MSKYNDEFFFNLAEQRWIEPDPDPPEIGQCYICGYPIYKNQEYDYIDGKLKHWECNENNENTD